MIGQLIAAYIAAKSPQTASKTTLYGYKAHDVYPCTERKIGRHDDLYGGNTIWHQQHPRNVRSVAHKRWRLGTWVVFLNPKNGKQVVARITDRGPYDYTHTESGKTTKGGMFDFSYPLGVELCHTGRQKIKYWRIKWGSSLHWELNKKYGMCPPENAKGKKWWQWKRKRCLKRGWW